MQPPSLGGTRGFTGPLGSTASAAPASAQVSMMGYQSGARVVVPGAETLDEDSRPEAWRRQHDLNAASSGFNNLINYGIPSAAISSVAQHERAAAAAAAAGQTIAAQEDGNPTALLFGADRFDNAVAAYGVQLKSWIDLQVEGRLNQFFQGFDGEMSDVRQDCHAALSLCERLEEQVLAVADAQARLNSKIEHGVEETSRLKAHLAASNVGNSTWERESNSFSSQLSELRRHSERNEAESSRHERSLAEHAELLRRLNAHSSEAVNEREHQLLALRRELEHVVLAVKKLQDEVEGHHDKHLGHHEQLAELGNRLRAEHSEKISVEAARLDRRVSELEGLGLLEIVSGRLEDSKREAALRFEQFQVRMAEDVLALQQRLLATMRAELAAAFRSEAAAVTALDEQLWQKDQKLRQEVDKVASQRTRDRIAVIERGEHSAQSHLVSLGNARGLSGGDGAVLREPPMRKGLHILNGSPMASTVVVSQDASSPRITAASLL